jgi:hypothetical protein
VVLRRIADDPDALAGLNQIGWILYPGSWPDRLLRGHARRPRAQREGCGQSMGLDATTREQEDIA